MMQEVVPVGCLTTLAFDTCYHHRARISVYLFNHEHLPHSALKARHQEKALHEAKVGLGPVD